MWIMEGTPLTSGGRKILLVSPDMDSNFNGIGVRRGRCIEENLGLVHIASALCTHRFRVFEASEEALSENCAETIVGLSVHLDNFHNAMALARLAKLHGAGYVVVGGPYASTRAEQIVANNPSVDYVIAGPAELLFGQVVETRPHGVIWSQNSGVATGILPNRKLWPKGNAALNGKPLALAYWAEGCPRAFDPCVFCSICHRPRMACRDVPSVIDEMRQLAELGYQAIEIGSDDFAAAATNDWLSDLAKLVNSSGLEFEMLIHAGVRSLLAGSKLELLSEIGVSTIQVGFESASPEFKPKASLPEEDELISRCTELGIKLLPSFIVGFPGETRKSAAVTFARARELVETGIVVGILADPLAPLPGSRAFDLLCGNHPEWSVADYIDPIEAMSGWFDEFTGLQLSEVLRERERFLADIPEDMMVAGVLLRRS